MLFFFLYKITQVLNGKKKKKIKQVYIVIGGV